MKRSIRLEEQYHNRVAADFVQNRERDYIWEIPERRYIFKPKLFRNKRVLEMGCGPAISIKNALPPPILSTVQYVGVDISSEMLRYAKMNIPFGRFVNASFDDIKIDKKFNTVVSLGALHHAPDQLKAFRLWLDAVGPQGCILLREPLFEALKKGEGASPIEEGIHVDEIIMCAEKQGFRLIEKVYFSSKFLHYVNKLQINMFRSQLSGNYLYWSLLTALDIALIKTLRKYLPIFSGEAVILILQRK